MNENQSGISQPVVVGEDLEKVGKRISRRLNDAASSLRSSGESEASNRLGPVKRRVASTLDSAASYLEGADMHKVTGNAIDMIRRYPFGSLAIGFGVGLLLGKMARR